MSVERRSKINLVPGIRFLNETHAAYLAGLDVGDESTILYENNDDSLSNGFEDTIYTRNLKKQGYNSVQIANMKRELRKKKTEENQRKIGEMLHGATDAYQYAKMMVEKNRRLSQFDQPSTSEIKQFSVPELPVNRRKSTQPKSHLTSTPNKSVVHFSWNESQVGNSTSIQENIIFMTSNGAEENRQCQVFKVPEIESNSVVVPANVTVTIDNGSSNQATLEKTHTIHREEEVENNENQVTSATFTVNDSKNSLQKTFTLDSSKNADSIHEDQRQEAEVQGGKNMTSLVDVSTISSKGRKKRDATASSKALMQSFMSNTPSPGAKYFNLMNKKKPKFAPNKSRNENRQSIDSDREKTIEMLSIAEITDIDGNMGGASYVSAVSINETHVVNDKTRDITTIQENKEVNNVSRHLKEAVTQTSMISRTVERIRDAKQPDGRVSIAVATSFDDDIVAGNNVLSQTVDRKVANNIQSTPTRNYERPTISSMNRSVLSKSLTKRVDRSFTLSQRLELEDDDHEETKQQQEQENEEEKEKEVETTKDTSIQPEVVQSLVEMSTNEPMDEQDVENTHMTENIARNSFALPQEDDIMDDIPEDGDNSTNSPSFDNAVGGVDSPPTPQNLRRVVIDDSSLDQSLIGRMNLNDSEESADETTIRESSRKGLKLVKRKIIEPSNDADDGLRRSTRNRCKPLRSWLGEQAIYVHSPSGGRRLKGVTDVIVTDKRYCKYLTADPKLATERQVAERAMKKERAAARRRELALQHKRGKNLNVSQDDIVTSDDDDEEEE